jgi:hypothetical protein
MPQQHFDNPVLQAYIQGVAMKREKEQDEFKNKLAQEADKRANEQQKLYADHLKVEEANENAKLDMQRTQIALERQQKELQARAQLAEMFSKGQAQQRQPTQAEMLSTPADGMIGGVDPRTISYSTPEQILAHDLTRASKMGEVQAQTQGKVTTAVEGAKAPFEQARDVRNFDQQKQLSTLGADQRTKLQELEGKQRLEQIGKTIEGQKSIAAMNGQYDLDRARITSVMGGITPEQWGDLTMSYALGKNARPLGNTPKDQLVKVHLQSQGLQELTSNKAQQLADLHGLDPLENTMTTMLAKLPTTYSGALKNRVMAKIPATDIQNMEGLLRAYSGQIARTVGQERGVMTEADIGRAMGLLTSTGVTADQAKERFNLFVQGKVTKALDVILGGFPAKQKLLILQEHRFDPKKFNSTVQFGTKEVPLFKQDPSDGEWLYFDPKRKGYVSVDATNPK